MILQSTRDLNHASIAKAMGHCVNIYRQPGSRRCVFYIPDIPEINELIKRYEHRELLPIPAKCLLNARTTLAHEARTVQEGL